MQTPRVFAAEILEQGASAFAGYAVETLFERDPSVRDRFADGASSSWIAHLRSRILELSAAVRMGEPHIFRNRVLWTRKAFRARGVPEEYLENSLEVLADVLSRELPEPARPDVLPVLSVAREALTGSEPEPEGGLDDRSAEGRLALEYLATVLEGRSREAVSLLLAATQQGMAPRRIVTDVLFQAQREIGRMWHEAETDVAEEHLLTATTLKALAVLGREMEPEPPNGKTVVLAAVQGNDHEVAVQALALLFELAGWKTVSLGGNVPSADVVRAVQYFDADLLVLSVTLGIQLAAAERLVAALRSIPAFDVRVLVGGHAFQDGEELWKRIGADGHARSIEAAVAEGARLVAMQG